ncbi:hypothetical protein, partial [Thiolapillus sp.]|uniref:hypothetical protein n=1 Tax=Thiolapillus sp. TaxID=2017437 RepID=UPI003AF75477
MCYKKTEPHPVVLGDHIVSSVVLFFYNHPLGGLFMGWTDVPPSPKQPSTPITPLRQLVDTPPVDAICSAG